MPKEHLWQKLANKLARRIGTGYYPVGGLLPTEAELCRTEGLSRNTVRAALAELKGCGLITRRPHEGTRVVSSGGAENFHQKISSLEDIDRFAHAYRREITDVQLVTADDRLAHVINCRRGMQFLRFTNLRHGEDADDPYVVYTKVFVNPAYVDLVREAGKRPDELIVKLIEDLYGKRCVKVTQSIQAVSLPEVAAKKLGAVVGEPALRILRHYLDAKNRILEISVSYHPGRRYAINMTLTDTSR